MVAKAITKIYLLGIQLLIIENVGNLVCPADYDLNSCYKKHIVHQFSTNVLSH